LFYFKQSAALQVLSREKACCIFFIGAIERIFKLPKELFFFLLFQPDFMTKLTLLKVLSFNKISLKTGYYFCSLLRSSWAAGGDLTTGDG